MSVAAAGSEDLVGPAVQRRAQRLQIIGHGPEHFSGVTGQVPPQVRENTGTAPAGRCRHRAGPGVFMCAESCRLLGYRPGTDQILHSSRARGQPPCPAGRYARPRRRVIALRTPRPGVGARPAGGPSTTAVQVARRLAQRRHGRPLCLGRRRRGRCRRQALRGETD